MARGGVELRLLSPPQPCSHSLSSKEQSTEVTGKFISNVEGRIYQK